MQRVANTIRTNFIADLITYFISGIVIIVVIAIIFVINILSDLSGWFGGKVSD